MIGKRSTVKVCSPHLSDALVQGAGAVQCGLRAAMTVENAKKVECIHRRWRAGGGCVCREAARQSRIASESPPWFGEGTLLQKCLVLLSYVLGDSQEHCLQHTW